MNKHRFRRGNSYKALVFKDMDDAGVRKFAKRCASKAVRKFNSEIPNGGAFKKLYSSYNIVDYRSDNRFSGPEEEIASVVFIAGEYHISK